MNKKQTAVTVLLLSLMFLLAITQSFFGNKFSRVSVTENTIEFKEYEFENYTAELPDKWTVSEEEIKDGYISYNIKFKSEDKFITGLVQVINTKDDIKNYAENDIKKQSLEYHNSEITPFENSESIGVLAKYDTNIKNGGNYINKCYYIKGINGQIIKMLFNISEGHYTKELDNTCLEIASSIKYNK